MFQAKNKMISDNVLKCQGEKRKEKKKGISLWIKIQEILYKMITTMY